MRYARRLALTAAGCGLLLLAAGCGVMEGPSSTDAETSSPAQSSDDAGEDTTPATPAAEAGGICEYLDFAWFSDATGQAFSVAESGGADEVTSCVLLTTTGKLPEITLTKAKTATDKATYKDEIPPKGSEKVKDLGKVAYSAVREPEGKIGPAVEIGWLAGGQMYSLRYTTAADTDADEVAGTVEALVAAARQVGEAAAKDEKKD